MALRTLRQRPTVVGRTDDGTTVYEIRSVRLVLTPGSSHFRRLVPCAKCDREVPGSSIQSVLDLDRPANSVFCDRCSKSSHSPGPEIGRTRQDAPASAPPAAAPPVVMKGAVEARRLAPAESQMAEVRSPAPAPAEKAGELQRFSEQVADLLRRQNAELAKVSASVAQVRAEMRELGESNLALARGQRDLDQRIIELESHPAAEIEAASARELADVRASLAAMVDTERVELRAALAEAVGLLRAEVAGIESRIGDGSAALSAREDFERRLERLQRMAEEGERQREALTASADAVVSRHHALEQRINATAQQLARLIEVQTQTVPAPPGGPPVPGGIIESLERQLRAAEVRLWRTTSDVGGE